MLLNAPTAGQTDLRNNRLHFKKGSVYMEEEQKKNVIEKGEELMDKDLEKVSGGSKAGVSPASWHCPQCHELNNPYAFKCSNCGADRP